MAMEHVRQGQNSRAPAALVGLIEPAAMRLTQACGHVSPQVLPTIVDAGTPSWCTHNDAEVPLPQRQVVLP
jgi:hypothetical protein